MQPTQDRINKANRLIAEFMNYPNGKLFHGSFHPKHQFPFDSSYDALMPVLEKICRLRISDGIEFIDYAYPRTFGMINQDTGQIMVRLNGHALFEADTLIEATYLAIIDFIKGYNKTELISKPTKI